MIVIFRFMGITNWELSSSRIISVAFSDCELAIENQHILLTVHDFLYICPAKWRTFRLWLLIQQVLHFIEVITIILHDVILLASFLTCRSTPHHRTFRFEAS